MSGCKYCGSTDIEINKVTFNNNTNHLEIKCLQCERKIGYAPQDIDINKMTMPFGKHKGKRLSEIDLDYLEWAVENLKPNLAKKINKYLEQINSYEEHSGPN